MRYVEYVAPTSDHMDDHPVHADTPLLGAGACSYITVLVYLNSDFEGGELCFLPEGEALKAPPMILPYEGLVVIFPHHFLHQAKAVRQGTKQLLKISVLYSSDGDFASSDRVPGFEFRGGFNDCHNFRLVRLVFFHSFGFFKDSSLDFQMFINSGSGSTCQENVEEPVPFVAAPENLETAGRNEGRDKDDLIFLIQTAKRLSTADSLEAFLDFVLQHDVNNESWAFELFTNAFMLFAHALTLQNEKLKMKAYQALDLTKVLHGHELCVLLGETLMRDFTEGPSTALRLAALHATLTLIQTEECQRDVLLKALKDPEPTIRLRALEGLVLLLDASREGVTEGKGNRPKEVYEASLKRLMSTALGAELSLTLQALVLLEPER